MSLFVCVFGGNSVCVTCMCVFRVGYLNLRGHWKGKDGGRRRGGKQGDVFFFGTN